MTDQTGQSPEWPNVLAGAALASLAAVPASALSLVIACGYDRAAQRLIDVDAPIPETAPLVEPYSVGDGFVAWEVVGNDATRAVLQHCPSGQELLAVFPGGRGSAAFDRYEEMLFGEAPYTMRQIGEEIAPMGAGARLSENELGSCACDLIEGSE